MKTGDKFTNIDYNLRKFRNDDIDTITKYANNQNIAKWLTKEFPSPYSKKDAENFINITSKKEFMKVFAIEVNGEAAGSISLSCNSKNEKNIIFNSNKNIKKAEIGYWLAEKYWNNGITTSAIKEIIEYGFNNYKIECIYATPFENNIISQKILSKAGFNTDSKIKKIIKNNESYDVIIYSIKNDSNNL
ncbi:hypothetical protein SDC9_17801 [bioreactor metagenome]|uniref:N-acetyltransferase domain-containing protein n=1 Tax=bioreactor metagenome TaxID=1076179 RepID=A0A644U0Q8_9ZZZZ|nr:GNAT family protein [Methanobrevibacter sp.]MEA4956479.1 GNAT family protein [Methanobrevibacter sp.]